MLFYIILQICDAKTFEMRNTSFPYNNHIQKHVYENENTSFPYNNPIEKHEYKNVGK